MPGMIEVYGIRSAKASCFGTVVLVGSGVLVYKWVKYRQTMAKVNQKLRELTELKSKTIHQLKESCRDQDEIAEMSAEEIIKAAQEGNLDPLKVVELFMYKACLLDKDTNCITWILEDAKQQALKLAYTDKPHEMPLYGLPVSLKESIQTKGIDSTFGMTKLLGNIATDDAVIVKVLKHCGAIPYAKTNIPQLMLSLTSCNPIFGETNHPLRKDFAPGGSSAGEGALVGGGASPLGFGTDIAGSIRHPAHLCGICGLKPTKNRISKNGIVGGLPGQTLIASTVGPMAKDVTTLVLAMNALLSPLMFQLDPYVPPMPFDFRVFKSTRKLRIGFYNDDGYNEPIPAIKRAVDIARRSLEAQGHTLVPFKPPRVADAMRIYTAALYADGGATVMKSLKNEIEEPRLKILYNKWKYPKSLRWIISSLMGLKWSNVSFPDEVILYRLSKCRKLNKKLPEEYLWPRVAQDFYLHGGEDHSVDRLWDLESQTSNYKAEFFDCWDSKDGELDGLICPPYPIVAAPFKHFENMTATMSYLALFNLTNCPAGVVPVTKVTQNDIDLLQGYIGHYNDPWDKNLKMACKDSLNMPVGVQCVAKPWRDEMCLKIMHDLELSLKQ